MHFEFLVEEESSEKMLDNLIPKILDESHTFDIRFFMGKPDLLQKLPLRLMGYKKTLNENVMIIVMVDNDRENCIMLKSTLEDIASKCNINTKTNPGSMNVYNVINRIVCEELESWFLGDTNAIKGAYPNVSIKSLKRFKNKNPDEIANPSLILHRIMKDGGYYRRKHMPKKEVSERVSENMNPNNNTSRSFNHFITAIRI